MPDWLYRSYLFDLPRVGNVHWDNHNNNTTGKKLHWVVNGYDLAPHVASFTFGTSKHRITYGFVFPTAPLGSFTQVRTTYMASILCH